VSFLYQYSLDFLLDIFSFVLKSPELAETQDYAKRLQIITANLFQVIRSLFFLYCNSIFLQTVYKRVSRGMLHADKVLLALLMLRIHIKGVPSEPAYEAQWDLLLGRSEVLAAKGGQSIFSLIFYHWI